MQQKPRLSVEDAELFASRIRPSWELIDEVAREDLLADLAAPAGAKPPSDTLIEGVPTFAVGDDAPTTRVDDVLPVVALDPAARAAFVKGPANETTNGAAAEAAPAAVLAPPARAGKTRMGMGAEGEAEAAPAPAAPASRRAVRTAQAVPTGSANPAAPTSAAKPVDLDDDIQIPGTGSPVGLLVKIGVAVAAVIGLAVVGFGVLGGKNAAHTTPTVVATAPTAPVAPTTQAQPPPVPPPEPAATAASAAASTTPSAKPVAPPEPEPKKTAAPPPEPKKAAAPPPEPKKAAAPPPSKPPAKKGGIIRETPF